ncbi:hypothetical protein GI374_12375 [Paracoccus sp. S-4012]|uniref:MerR family transcriptional regulator n=1 Tax=Paracoccus sp. S-4012 TaxID=2665648 RepID=UPI0012AF6E77|nr:MerR family transcriptional regulator [Paracoccus sp. S-4012]MRX51225.1 hypothetical protein [Paracoccus sp. S-4012]
MSARYTQAEVLEAVADLTEARLTAWVEARIVLPEAGEGGHRYREVDLARLQTLCDLHESYGLSPDALGMVMSLMDQLNVLRGEMEALMEALAAEPAEVRTRIRRVIATRIAPE